MLIIYMCMYFCRNVHKVLNPEKKLLNVSSITAV